MGGEGFGDAIPGWLFPLKESPGLAPGCFIRRFEFGGSENRGGYSHDDLRPACKPHSVTAPKDRR